MQTKTLLVEIRCEELPPAQVIALMRGFADELLAALGKNGFVEPAIRSWNLPLATPRRFAALLSGIYSHAPTSQVLRKGPPLDNCYDEKQQPTAALQGFMKSVGATSPDQLEEMEEKGRKYVAFDETRGGNALADALADIVQEVLLGINAPRLMRWGNNEFKFIRPLRGVLMMHGSDVLDGTVLGVTATATTRGHPTLANKDIAIDHADEYVKILKEQGEVIVNFNDRYVAVNELLGDIHRPPALTDEVTALCEQPVVYEGAIDENFLKLPDFCVKECMVVHQRAFPVHKNGNLTTAYRFVADNRPKDPAALINGMNTVLRARLRDVEFYREEDKKQSLETALDKLNNIVYHRKLGSQRERVDRLVAIADLIGERLGLDEANRKHLRRAAEICKSDLSTLMIGEYPALEGLVAADYFCGGQSQEVRELVKLHNGRPPDNRTTNPLEFYPACAMLLTVTLEKLLGMFAIGEKPSGSKDPHGLRGAAAAVAELLTFCGREIKLIELLDAATAVTDLPAQDTTAVRDFIVERRRQHLLAEGTPTAVLNAVLATPPDYLIDIQDKSIALNSFLDLPEAESLIEANKRINNILRKSNAADLPAVDENLLQDDAERALYKQLVNCRENNKVAIGRHDYRTILQNTAALRDDVDNFFDKVLVNAEDEKLRANRLALLAALRDVFNTVGDLAKLSGG